MDQNPLSMDVAVSETKKAAWDPLHRIGTQLGSYTLRLTTSSPKSPTAAVLDAPSMTDTVASDTPTAGLTTRPRPPLATPMKRDTVGERRSSDKL